MSPRAAAAPAFMRAARVEPAGHNSRARPATARSVPAGSPEAATMTSVPAIPRRPTSWWSVRLTAAASFRTGMTIDTRGMSASRVAVSPTGTAVDVQGLAATCGPPVRPRVDSRASAGPHPVPAPGRRGRDAATLRRRQSP